MRAVLGCCLTPREARNCGTIVKRIDTVCRYFVLFIKIPPRTLVRERPKGNAERSNMQMELGGPFKRAASKFDSRISGSEGVIPR
jgi:hypothetical protein